MHNFEKLKIWQKAMDIAVAVYDVSLQLPSDEKFNLIHQIKKCAISIPSNIAEGSNRENKHFQHYLNISLGSSFELQTQLLIANQNKYITDEKLIEIENKIIEFQKMTTWFIIKLEI